MRILHSTVALFLAACGTLAAQPQSSTPAQTEYQVFFRGIPIGSETVSVSRDAEGMVVTGSSRIGAPVSLTIRRAEVRYTAAGAPVSCLVEGSVQDKLLSIITNVSGTTATTDVTQGAAVNRKTDQVAPNAVLLLNAFFGSYEALSLRLVNARPNDEIPVYVPPAGGGNIRVTTISTERLRTPAGPLEARRVGIRIPNPGTPLDAEVWSTTDGHLLRFSVVSQGFDLVRTDIASVSARREPVSRPNDEQVRIQANGFSLAGTLSRPAGAVSAGTRLPIVVLVAGSGPADRDETLGGIPIFGQLASTLADAGNLVIRYDKRGVGQSGGRLEASTLADYADDAMAVVKSVRKRKDVDSNRVVLLGYGEGGMVAMLAASRDGDVKGVVLVATPGVSGADLVLEQQQRALAGMTLSDADRQAKIALQEKIQKAVLTGQGWEGVPPEMRRQADTPWFRSYLAFDPASVMRKVDQPVLVVQGDLDTEVAPANADKLGNAAKARKGDAGRMTQVVHVPGVNHLLVEARTGEVNEYASLADKAVSEAVTKPIADWLKTLKK